MPTVSKKQEKFMQAVAHNPKFAKAAGVPQSVGKEFTKSGGGMPVKPKSVISDMASEANDATQARANRGVPAKSEKMSATSNTDKPGFDMKMKKGGKVKKMASGGMTSMGKVKTAAPSRDGIAVKGKTKGKMITMAGGKGMKKGGYC